MVGEVFAGIGAFNSMFGIAKAIRDMDDTVKRNAAVADLWEQIIAAQTRYMAAIEQVGELKEELRGLETWEAEKQRYKLPDFGGGTFAYALKPEAAQGEPAHRVCAHCYHDGHIAILQFSTKASGQDYFDCLRCKSRQAFGIYQSTADYGSLEDDEGGWQVR